MNTGRELLEYLWQQFPATKGNILLNQLVSAVELEAYAKGMTDAAIIADKIECDDQENYGISEAIETARDNTTQP